MSRIRLTPQLLRHMCLPQAYWQCKLEEIPDDCPHKKVIVKYLGNLASHIRTGSGLLLWGDYSTGKSGLGAIILKAAATLGKVGCWVRSGNLARYVIEKTWFDPQARIFMWERVMEVPVLVLDEVIVRGDDRFSDTVIEDLIRERVNETLPTIITTNLRPGIFSEKYPALAAVLREAALPVRVSGFNFRDGIERDLKEELGNG